jgi:Cysteine-rich secretory protein family
VVTAPEFSPVAAARGISDDQQMRTSSILCCGILLAVATPVSAKAKSNCALMQRLAQQHSNDMARRNSMDHAGFHNRAKQGARAENVAMGSTTKAGTMAQWWTSPGHARNMLLPGCKAVAHAVSKSGQYYWTMLIGR